MIVDSISCLYNFNNKNVSCCLLYSFEVCVGVVNNTKTLNNPRENIENSIKLETLEKNYINFNLFTSTITPTLM